MRKQWILIFSIIIMLVLIACQSNPKIQENTLINSNVEVQDISDIFQYVEDDNVIPSNDDCLNTYISSEDLDSNIRNIYDNVISIELENPRFGEQAINYGYGYIDGDIIPELFLVRGTSHIDTVTIYTYDEKLEEAIYVGDFGGWGYCDYVPYENKIISCYGNHGYFYITVTKINENKEPELVDVILRSGGGMELKSYYGFELGDFTGAIDWDNYDINQFVAPGEEYLITEEEAEQIENEIRDGAIRINLSDF